MEYQLTAFGESLAPILVSLRDWGQRYQRGRQASEVVALTGT